MILEHLLLRRRGLSCLPLKSRGCSDDDGARSRSIQSLVSVERAMHATDTRETRQNSRQTDLRTFGFVTADQLRFDEHEYEQENTNE